MTQLLFTTNPGLEDVAGAEFEERTARAGLGETAVTLKPFDLDGQVTVDNAAPLADLWPLAQQMRSIYHVIRPLHVFDLPDAEPLAHIRRVVGELEIVEMETAGSFRVTGNRTGEHPFTSVDVQRVAGAALVEKYGTAVDLTGYDTDVRVDVVHDRCWVGVQLTRTRLSKRQARVYTPMAALKTVVAYAMLRFARLEAGTGGLLDPFCGSGTILIEAAQTFPDLPLYGSDAFAKPVQGTADNLAAMGLTEQVALIQADARDLRHHYEPGSMRAIVTNPPFGVRLGRRADFRHLYSNFLQGSHRLLEPGGRLVVLVGRRRAFNYVLDKVGGFHLAHVRVIDTGGIYPAIFVLERRQRGT
ncbi:MAG: THUMP domain-containing protein [Chloroflexota bacterium]